MSMQPRPTADKGCVFAEMCFSEEQENRRYLPRQLMALAFRTHMTNRSLNG